MSRRDVLEAHLKTATDALARRADKLKAKDLKTKKQHRRDPAFRQIEAKIRDFKHRISALEAVDKLNASLVERRAVKAATPKVKKEKKKPAAAAPKKAAKKPKKDGEGA